MNKRIFFKLNRFLENKVLKEYIIKYIRPLLKFSRKKLFTVIYYK